MTRILIAALFLASTALAYEPGEYAIDIDSDLATFFAQCAAGEDSNTNVYDSVGDWTNARLNESGILYHCVEAGDYEGHNDVTITVDGRVYGFYDDDLAGDAITCGNGTFYETPGWGLRADGFAGRAVNGAYAAVSTAVFEKITVSGSDNIFFCLEATDPDGDGPSGPLLHIRDGADDNVFSHMYIHSPNDETMVRVLDGASFNTIQYSVIECEKSSGNREIGVIGLIDHTDNDAGAATQRYNVVSSSEIFNCADSFQSATNINGDHSTTDNGVEGWVVENTDMYVTSAMYINCATGAFDAAGDCACAENAIDLKIGVNEAATVQEVDGTAWSDEAIIFAGDIRRPTMRNGFAYYATTSGFTGGSEPTWPTAWRGTVTDGDITWLAIHTRNAFRGNTYSGYRPARPDVTGPNCGNLGSPSGAAITAHYVHSDYHLIADGLFYDAHQGFWHSKAGPDNISFINNVFWNVDGKGCNLSGCLSLGVLELGRGDNYEAYHNLFVESAASWLDNNAGGDISVGGDARANLIIVGQGGNFSAANGSNTSHNAWINTTATAGIGSSVLYQDNDLATRANSTAYATGDLLIAGNGNGAMYEVQGDCTSAGSPPTWQTELDADVTDGSCTLTVVRGPLRFTDKRWTSPTVITIPYGLGGASASPLSAYPGDVNQGCQAGAGVSDNVPSGVTC